MHVSGGTLHHRLLTRYAQHSRLLGWILFLTSVIVIGVGIFVGDGLGVLISAVGGSLMPAAIVNAWLDPLLREDAARDMKDLLDIRSSVVDTGFLAARRSSNFEVGAFVGRTNVIDILPLNHRDWMNRDYSTILELCKASAVTVRIFLSAPDEPWCTVLAHRNNSDVESVRDQLTRLPDQLLRAWDAAHPHGGSRIEIFYFDGVQTNGLMLCDGGVAIEFGPAVRDEEVKVPGHVLTFDSTSDVGAWVKRQLAFGSGQSPPIAAGLRPLRQVEQPKSIEDTSAQSSIKKQEGDASRPVEPGAQSSEIQSEDI